MGLKGDSLTIFATGVSLVGAAVIGAVTTGGGRRIACIVMCVAFALGIGAWLMFPSISPYVAIIWHSNMLVVFTPIVVSLLISSRRKSVLQDKILTPHVALDGVTTTPPAGSTDGRRLGRVNVDLLSRTRGQIPPWTLEIRYVDYGDCYKYASDFHRAFGRSASWHVAAMSQVMLSYPNKGVGLAILVGNRNALTIGETFIRDAFERADNIRYEITSDTRAPPRTVAILISPVPAIDPEEAESSAT